MIQHFDANTIFNSGVGLLSNENVLILLVLCEVEEMLKVVLIDSDISWCMNQNTKFKFVYIQTFQPAKIVTTRFWELKI